MMLSDNSKYLITGAAGFIGFHLSKSLLEEGYEVVGLDNLNDYYSVSLKNDRLAILKQYEKFTFEKADLVDKEKLEQIFEENKFDVVINLAAQAGVRYSIDHPEVYINSNLIGFYNILECCRHYPVKHFLFASSSSIYGNSSKIPFSVEDKTDEPISLYAATKKSNELLAYSYSHLYGIHTTGVRLFTVYGPMGRPDMAYFSFSNQIMEDKAIKIFNNGDLYRDFTYVDDIVTGIRGLISKSKAVTSEEMPPFKVYNIGNHKPEKLIDFIHYLEDSLGKEAKKEYYPMQAGDVYQTYADTTDLMNDVGFMPSVSLKDGLDRFVSWYKEYYKYE